ncbi:MAG: hypothetical protein C0598_11765 [Marinilabiliales bacterium]|nr:MAG: hypothetical protein C0598_11765 [Marinilabiliales bacterium]
MFWKRKKYQPSGSLNAIAWRKLLSNPMAKYSFLGIFIFVFFAISGYLLTPDSSPYANQQILEISNQKPGFKVQMIEFRRNEIIESKNMLSKMLFGQRNKYQEIPIDSFHYNNQYVVYNLFDDKVDTLKINIADILFPLGGKPVFNKEKQIISYSNISN